MLSQYFYPIYKRGKEKAKEISPDYRTNFFPCTFSSSTAVVLNKFVYLLSFKKMTN